jgi:hypothetical protein
MTRSTARPLVVVAMCLCQPAHRGGTRVQLVRGVAKKPRPSGASVAFEADPS